MSVLISGQSKVEHTRVALCHVLFFYSGALPPVCFQSLVPAGNLKVLSLWTDGEKIKGIFRGVFRVVTYTHDDREDDD